MSREKLREEIISICSNWVPLDYLATTIGRNPDYLLSDVIPSMLKDGLIERMYPQTPKHPNQRYKKKEGV